jgi:hypothetical protein
MLLVSQTNSLGIVDGSQVVPLSDKYCRASLIVSMPTPPKAACGCAAVPPAATARIIMVMFGSVI